LPVDVLSLVRKETPDMGEAVLDKNENPFSPPPALVEELRGRMASIPLNRYPDPTHESLREALGSFAGYPAGCVSVGNGGDEILSMLFSAFVSPGDSVLTLSPCFSQYGHLCRVQGARHVTVALGAAEKCFELDGELFLDTMARCSPKLILIDRPNNPTGCSVPLEMLRRIIDMSPCEVVVDEAYVDFGPDSVLDLYGPDSIPDNLLVLRTFSKAWGLAAIRLGWGVSSRRVVSRLEDVRSPYNVNCITREVALIALKYRQWHRDTTERIVYTRDRFLESLSGLQGWRAYEGNGNFVFARSPVPWELLDGALRREGFHLRRIPMPDHSDGDWVRISVGREEHMREMLGLLEKM